VGLLGACRGIQRSGDAETIVKASANGIAPEAKCRAEESLYADPRTSAKHTVPAIPTCPGNAVGGRVVIVRVPTVLHPLPSVAMHIVKTKSV
jgi:hypothetical protein